MHYAVLTGSNNVLYFSYCTLAQPWWLHCYDKHLQSIIRLSVGLAFGNSNMLDEVRVSIIQSVRLRHSICRNHRLGACRGIPYTCWLTIHLLALNPIIISTFTIIASIHTLSRLAGEEGTALPPFHSMLWWKHRTSEKCLELPPGLDASESWAQILEWFYVHNPMVFMHSLESLCLKNVEYCVSQCTCVMGNGKICPVWPI